MNEIDISNMLPYGSMLDGRYRVEQYLASGGFGNTYAAYDTRFDCRVAVKEFFMRGINHRNSTQDSVEISNAANIEGFITQLSKFKREAKRIFNLRNEHIVHVIDLFDANGTSYYVMDLIEGESLKDRIRRHPLTEKEVINVADQLLYALKTVHEAGFFHLDVKPGNIMIDKNNHCILIDFGASKQMATKDGISMSTSSMAYTPGYAPIEQVGQITQHIGPWSDFYAVGATLYNLLTGKNPPEIDPYDTHENSRIFSYPEAVSIQMKRAISCMMNPDYRKRPQNVEAMKMLLDGNRHTPDKYYKAVPQKSNTTESERNLQLQETQIQENHINSNSKKNLKSVAKDIKSDKGNRINWIVTLVVVITFASFILYLNNSKTEDAVQHDLQLNQEATDNTHFADNEVENESNETSRTHESVFDRSPWYTTDYGFKVPNIMSLTSDIWVDELPSSIDRWDYEDVCLSFCSLLGNWAVEEYPEVGRNITEDLTIKSVTYKDDSRMVYSGYTSDGRIWYMKKHITTGGATSHANFLAVIYPTSMQSEVSKLIDTVKDY